MPRLAQFTPNYSNIIFSDDFSSIKSVSDNSGTITSAPIINHALKTDGTDDKVAYPLVRQVKSISFWITLATTTEDIMELSSSHSVEAVSGTLTATGVSSPTFYVNGTATATIGTTRAHVVITTATAFDANAFVVGADDSYGEFTMEDLQLWNVTLTAEEAKDLYEKDAYAELERAIIDLPLRTSYYKENGVELIVGSNMELANWGVGSSATLSNPVTGTLRVAYNGTSNPYATQSILVSGLKYKITGTANGDGSFAPEIKHGLTTIWTGTTSATPQPFSVIFDSTASSLRLYSNASSSGYAEFTDVSVELMEAQTENKGSLGGAATLGDGTTTTTFPTQLSPHGISCDNGDYLDLGNSSNLNISTGDISFICMVVTDQTGTTRFIGGKLNSIAIGDAQGYGMYLGMTGTLWSWLIASGGGVYAVSSSASSAVSVGKKTTLIGTYDSVTKTATLYVNGIAQTPSTQAGLGSLDNSANLEFGGAGGVGGAPNRWLGKIYSPKIIKKCLTPLQVKKAHHSLLAQLNI